MKPLRGNFDTQYNTYIAAGEPLIFHCHHYNTFLQATLEDTKDYIDIYPILIESAQEIVYAQMNQFFSENQIAEIEERKQIAEDFFMFCGYGKFSLENVSVDGGKVISESDHYSYGWKSKFGLRAENEPMVSFFTRGFLTGATEAIFNLALGSMECKQLSCYTKNDSFVSFELTKNINSKKLSNSPKQGTTQNHTLNNPNNTSVNYLGIREALTNMPIEGTPSSKGIIDAFGVLLTRMYSNYYCQTSYRMLKKLEETMGSDGLMLADQLLTEAGHVCAFNTFGGIMQSAEWNGLIKPMCQTREDWVHGIVAVVNAFGWGFWEILELEPAKKLVVKVTNGYEANSYLQTLGKSSIPISFLAKGGTKGIMNLIYNGDITTQPSLTDEYYSEICNSPKAFSVRQTKCRAMGDDQDIFEVYL